jgi:integrase
MVMATLRRILAYAEAREEIGRNPVEVWKRSRGRRRRSDARIVAENVVDHSELNALLAEARSTFPDAFPLLLFLTDTGARLGEALALRWVNLNIKKGTASIHRSFSSGKRLSPTKTGSGRRIELSQRLGRTLAEIRPDVFGDEDLVFPSAAGGLMDPYNFRERVFRRLVRRVLGQDRRFTPHGLRHTFASLHMARSTPLKWIQTQGGWASAKVLLDTYGHYLPTEAAGHADALGDAPERPYAAPRRQAISSMVTGEAPADREKRVTPRASTRPAWWARLDSNQGPPACKAGALTN